MTHVVTDDLVLFYGRGDPFSHHHQAEFRIKKYRFNCVEQHLMFCKAVFFGDWETAYRILDAPDPVTQFRLGRQVKDFSDVAWENKRLGYALVGNLAKYRQNPELKQLLIDTGSRTIAEASPNKVWGIGYGKDSPEALQPSLWTGENLGGFVMMSAREILKSETGD